MHWFRSGLLLAFSSVAVLAQEPARHTGRILYLTAARPLLLEVSVLYNGKPLTAVSDEVFQAEFKRLDADADGQLSSAEQERLPSRYVLQAVGLVHPGHVPQLSGDSAETIEDVAGLRRLYRNLGFTQVRLYDDPTRVLDAGRVLFERLDRSANRRLSLQEIAQASQTLWKFDQNGDEKISSRELSGMSATAGITTSLATFQFFLLDEAVPRSVLNRCVRTYARADQQSAVTLPRTAFWLSDELLDRVDGNQDGDLTPAEWESFLLAGRADVTITARFGQTEHAAERLVVSVNPPGPPHVTASENSLSIDASRVLVSGRSLVSESVTPRRLLLGFHNMDRDGNGYVEFKEAANRRSVHTFRAWDVDRDGKLSAEEYVSGIRPLLELAKCQIEIRVDDAGGDLFSIADTWSDGELTPRELHALSRAAMAWDRNADREVSAEEFPSVYRFQVTHGSFLDPGEAASRPGTFELGTQNRVLRSSNLKWFNAMDRNRDGDVSRREFPGTDEHFRRLDADGDGLIDHAEAETAGVNP